MLSFRAKYAPQTFEQRAIRRASRQRGGGDCIVMRRTAAAVEIGINIGEINATCAGKEMRASAGRRYKFR